MTVVPGASSPGNMDGDTLVPVTVISKSEATDVPPSSLITCLITISVASSVFSNVQVTRSPTLSSIGDTVAMLSHDDVASVHDASESSNPGGKNVGKAGLKSYSTEYVDPGMTTIWPVISMLVPEATVTTSSRTPIGPVMINLKSVS